MFLIQLFFSTLVLAESAKEFIPNGIVTEAYPEVIELKQESSSGIKSGTGVLISPNFALTAAHVVSEASPDLDSSVLKKLQGMVRLKGGRKQVLKPKATFRIGSYVNHCRGNLRTQCVSKDLAVILWDRPVSFDIEYPKMRCQASPKNLKNQEVRIVGFGVNDLDAKIFTGLGKKREGSTQIFLQRSGLIYIAGLTQNSGAEKFPYFGRATGENISVGPGDSGSPVYDKSSNDLLGIASAISELSSDSLADYGIHPDHKNIGFIVDLCSRQSQGFFQELRAYGVNVPVEIQPVSSSAHF